LNVNTAEEFRLMDKNELMAKMGAKLLGQLFKSGNPGIQAICETPQILSSFVCLSFAVSSNSSRF